MSKAIRESEMYPEVCCWLLEFLEHRHPKAEIQVFDTSARILSRVLYDLNLHKLFSDHENYEIKVDVTGVILSQDAPASLAFVECKVTTVSLKDVSQLLGYSLVANPLYSFLLSTKGVSRSVFNIIESSNNLSVLTYGSNRCIRYYRWVIETAAPDMTSVLPTGMHQ